MSGRLLADRYELVERIGSGGMADVWEAIDHSLGRRVAVKMLHRHLAADPTVLLRFRSEAHSAARLTHPGIVAIYDTVTTDDTDAIIMELVDGRDLRTILDERPTLASADAVEVGVQVAAGLGHAHMNGIIHRDVKPANILVRPDRRVKLSDFGIAKALDQTSHTESGSLVGTVKYLAPEQIEGHGVDGRTDLYGLTTVLYEMLCGQVPFAAQDLVGAMDRIRRDPPSARSIRPDLPPALDQFLTKGLARNPADRYPDASTWSASLAAAMRGDQTIIEQVPTVASRPTQPAPLPPIVSPPASIPTTGPGPGSARPPSSAVRDQEQVPLAKHHRRKRSRLAFLGPLIALALMIAAVATVWMLLKPAGDAVGDRFGEADTALDETTTSADGSSDSGVVVDDPSAETDATSTTSNTTATTTVAPFIDGRRTIGFDPLGDNDEHNEASSRAVDGDPSTFWYTQSYTTRQFGNIKEGVGLIVEFEEPQPISRLRVSTSRVGWAARVYEADEPAGSLDGWGEAIGGFADLEQTDELDVPDISVTAVLLWITDVGVDPGQTPEDYDAQVAEGGFDQRLEIFEIELVG
jgi:serine/threonine protein kinase